jgi:hypothetical protein
LCGGESVGEASVGVADFFVVHNALISACTAGAAKTPLRKGVLRRHYHSHFLLQCFRYAMEH